MVRRTVPIVPIIVAAVLCFLIAHFVDGHTASASVREAPAPQCVPSTATILKPVLTEIRDTLKSIDKRLAQIVEQNEKASAAK